MKRLQMTLGLMILGIAIMLLDLVWHSPLTMTIFLSAGFGCAALAIVLFVLDVRDNLRVRVTVVDDAQTDAE